MTSHRAPYFACLTLFVYSTSLKPYSWPFLRTFSRESCIWLQEQDHIASTSRSSFYDGPSSLTGALIACPIQVLYYDLRYCLTSRSFFFYRQAFDILVALVDIRRINLLTSIFLFLPVAQTIEIFFLRSQRSTPASFVQENPPIASVYLLFVLKVTFTDRATLECASSYFMHRDISSLIRLYIALYALLLYHRISCCSSRFFRNDY